MWRSRPRLLRYLSPGSRQRTRTLPSSMFSVVRLHAYSSGRALALRIILECVLRTADLRVVAGPPLFHFFFPGAGGDGLHSGN